MPFHSHLKYQYKTSVGMCLAEVYLWNVIESEQTLMELVSDMDLSVLNNKKYTNNSRRIEWLAVRALLHQIYPQATVEYTKNGKPCLSNISDQQFISISHTKGWVAIAISSIPIGIDIERWSERPLKVSQKFLTEEEIMKFQVDNTQQAVRLWTIKEAAFKCFDQTQTHVISEIKIKEKKHIENTFSVNGVGEVDRAVAQQTDFSDFSLCVCALIDSSIFS